MGRRSSGPGEATVINISIKDATVLDQALQRLVDDAEQATMGAVKGLVGYALAFIVPRTPQWSGELVSQWRVTAAGAAAPRYRPMGYKDSVEAPWPVPKDYDDLDPYHATRNPNDVAMLDARERTEADLRELVQSKALLRGATIWLPYTYDGEDIDGLGRFSNATRHIGFAGALDRLDTNLRTRYTNITKAQAAAMLKTPIPWAQQARLAQQAYTFSLGVRKDNRAKATEARRRERIMERAAEKYEAKRIKRAEREAAKSAKVLDVGGGRKRVLGYASDGKLRQNKPTPLPGMGLLDQLSNANKRR